MTPLLAASVYWDLPVLIVLVSLIYSATRYDQWKLILQESVQWAYRMTTFLGGIAIVLFIISRWI